MTVKAQPPHSRLKHNAAFSGVYRRGRWVRGQELSVGILSNGTEGARVGLRTRRGLKGATVRNRLKRQLRTLVYPSNLPLRAGLDVVIVIHPTTLPASTAHLREELLALCKRVNALR